MACRQFKLFNQSENILIDSWFSETFQNWMQEWMQPDNAAVEFKRIDSETLSAEDLGYNDWWTGCIDQASEMWIAFRLKKSLSAEFSKIVSTLIGSSDAVSRQSSLAVHVVKEAYMSLMNALAAYAQGNDQLQLGFDNSQPDVDVISADNGALAIELRIGDEITPIILSPTLVDNYLNRHQHSEAEPVKMPELELALDNQRVAVQAWIGYAELGVVELQNIAVGDVVRLDSKVEQTVALKITGRDETICYGYLGTQSGNRALQLTGTNEQ